MWTTTDTASVTCKNCIRVIAEEVARTLAGCAHRWLPHINHSMICVNCDRVHNFSIDGKLPGAYE